MNIKISLRIAILSFLIISVFLLCFSKENNVESVWRTALITIDGLDGDWTGCTLNPEKKYEVDYTFMNDDENLYVLFVFHNPDFLSTIKDTGMTLWLNLEGKTSKKYGVHYGLRQVTADALISMLEEQQGTLPEEKKKEIKSNPYYFLYRGEVVDKNGDVLTASALAEGLEAPTFRFGDRPDMLVYEFKMPLGVLEKLTPGRSLEPGGEVKVGFEWGGMTEAMKRARMRQLQTRSERDSEQRAQDVKEGESQRIIGGGSFGSGLGGNTKKYSFWVDVKLAQR